MLCFEVEGQRQTAFAKLSELQGSDARSIADAVLASLREFGVRPEQVVAFAADGASSFTGSHAGATELVRQELGFEDLQRIHCLAHRLELSSQAAFKGDEVYQTFETMLQRLIASIRHSPRRQARLAQLAEALGMRCRRIPAFAPTRWLSRSACLSVLVDEYVPLLALLQADGDFELYEYFADARVFLFACAMRDITDILAHFCEALQAEDLTAGRVFLELTQVLNALADMRQPAGGTREDPVFSLHLPCYRQGRAIVQQQQQVTVVGLEVDVSLKPLEDGALDEINTSIKSLAQALSRHLTSRFGGLVVYKALRILDPTFLPFTRDLTIAYVADFAQGLARLFAQLARRGIEEFTEDDCASAVRSLVSAAQTLRDAGVPDSVERIRVYHQEVYYNRKEGRIVALLYQYQAALCLTSVDCERFFSSMNIVKSDLRSRLLTPVLDDLLVSKSICNPPLDSLAGLNTEQAAARFVEMKNRRLI